MDLWVFKSWGRHPSKLKHILGQRSMIKLQEFTNPKSQQKKHLKLARCKILWVGYPPVFHIHIQIWHISSSHRCFHYWRAHAIAPLVDMLHPTFDPGRLLPPPRRDSACEIALQAASVRWHSPWDFLQWKTEIGRWHDHLWIYDNGIVLPNAKTMETETLHKNRTGRSLIIESWEKGFSLNSKNLQIVKTTKPESNCKKNPPQNMLNIHW